MRGIVAIDHDQGDTMHELADLRVRVASFPADPAGVVQLAHGTPESDTVRSRNVASKLGLRRLKISIFAARVSVGERPRYADVVASDVG